MSEVMDAIDGLKENLNAIVKTNKERAELGEQKSADLEQKLDNAVQAFEKKFTAFEAQNARQKESKLDAKAQKEFEEKLKRFNVALGEMKKSPFSLDKSQEIKSAMDVALTAPHNLTVEQKALMNTIIGTDGGFLVAPEYSQDIAMRRFDSHGIMGLVNRVNTASKSYVKTIDYADYSSWEYLNELANPTGEHDPNYKEVEIFNTAQIFKYRISRDLLEDAMFDVSRDVIEGAFAGADRQSATQVVIGNGVDKPKGILSYADGVGYDKLERVESVASLSLKWEDVITKLPAQLIGQYHENASYAMKRQSFFSLLSDKDGAGQFNIMNQINFFSGEGSGMFIMGHPVVFDVAMGETSVAGSDAVLFGDFAQAYTFTEREGNTIIIDDVTSAQNITYRLRRRNGGQLILGDALKSLKIQA